MWSAIIVAVITAVGGILAALIQSMRKENSADHGYVRDALGRVEQKLDNHIDDHLKGDV
jgi:Na+-translocating ferredoxin:NAD+ oxidoreductase RnfG subunit